MITTETLTWRPSSCSVHSQLGFYFWRRPMWHSVLTVTKLEEYNQRIDTNVKIIQTQQWRQNAAWWPGETFRDRTFVVLMLLISKPVHALKITRLLFRNVVESMLMCLIPSRLHSVSETCCAVRDDSSPASTIRISTSSSPRTTRRKGGRGGRGVNKDRPERERMRV